MHLITRIPTERRTQKGSMHFNCQLSAMIGGSTPKFSTKFSIKFVWHYMSCNHLLLGHSPDNICGGGQGGQGTRSPVSGLFRTLEQYQVPSPSPTLSSCHGLVHRFIRLTTN